MLEDHTQNPSLARRDLVRNPGLYDALSECCKTVLAHLKSNVEIPEDLQIVAELVSEAGARPTHLSALDITWHELAHEAVHHVHGAPSYQIARRGILKDETIAKHLNKLVGTDESRLHIDADYCLTTLLNRFLSDNRQLDFCQISFDSVYEAFEDYFYRNTVVVRFHFFLDGFHSEADRISLGAGSGIIKITPEEQRETLRAHSLPLSGEWAIEISKEIPKVIDDGNYSPNPGSPLSSQIATEEAEEICSALRLYKNGTVGFRCHRIDTDAIGCSGVIETSLRKTVYCGTPYNMPESEIPAFREFWRFFQCAKQRRLNKIAVALHRFDLSYERHRPEDKLIDYIIGFESLLLKRKEKRYKLVLRCGTLLGNTPAEREEISNTLKAAYRERSHIVHGEDLKKSVPIKGKGTVEFSEFVGSIEELLRLAIREFLIRTEDKGESAVIENLDERILSGF